MDSNAPGVAGEKREMLVVKPSGAPALAALRDVRPLPPLPEKCKLSRADIGRYSRQLVLPELGVKGQLKISNTSVLVVGCGGLGCPVAQYLAAAGIGRLGLVDHDSVELSNLHRQVLHTEQRVGEEKAASAACAVAQLNSTVEVVPYHLLLSQKNALQLVRQYDVVADCSDNVATRYLVSDVCVLAGKPLVSASALRMEGQLTVYNHEGGPCYRCLYPTPPPPETVTNCSDGGVLGVVPGIMGSLQALEVLKVAARMGSSYSGRLLVLDGLEGRMRSVSLRGRRMGCATCGDAPSVTASSLPDYEAWCGAAATDKCRRLMLLKKEERVTVEEYKALLDEELPHVLLDVRPTVEVDICHLPHSLNIPLSRLERWNAAWPAKVAGPGQELKTPVEFDDDAGLAEEVASADGLRFGGRQSSPEARSPGQGVELLLERIWEERRKATGGGSDTELPVFTICKQGNDSQVAVTLLRRALADAGEAVSVRDVAGGLAAWAATVDPDFPQY
ncbi:adenylyltransferase and sulfurtransferase MOCS3 [Petromyzon marinus]|uniref:Adenylyltransferase and sulfurtransferase MOCS3 n=1 Tax=Petromyzon marinus TaxID=7757 RepID=A0AAJ7WN94_PETMA|nr:adenylyltransferase and sulfurtransferase MOCS3 [Petromyzon marinus]